MNKYIKNILYSIPLILLLLILFQILINGNQRNNLILVPNIPNEDYIKNKYEINKHDKEEIQEDNKDNKNEIFKRPSKYPLNEPLSKKHYTIGIFPIPGIKMPTFAQHEYIKFIPLQIDKSKQNNCWANMGYYISLYGFEYRKDDKDIYPFKLYQEDITLHYDFVEFGKNKLDKFDLLFIPPVGVTFDTTFVNNFYEFIHKASHQYPNFCSLQTYMTKKDRMKNNMYDTNHVFKPNWPNSQFKMFGGIVIKPHIPEALNKFMVSTHYLNRYDYLLQHYCETVDEPIIVSPYNFYTIPSNAYH